MYSFKLTEEIARWAFEVECQQGKCWKIAFTNPTAGPWKTVKCTDARGNWGEVHRFELEDKRPDIILVNDELKIVMIFEAKDTLAKLVSGDQVKKSVDVVCDLFNILEQKENNPYWGQRSCYKVILGLLWGAETAYSLEERYDVLDVYQQELESKNYKSSDVIIGIETFRFQSGLQCQIIVKKYRDEKNDSISIPDIVKSFHINTIH